MTHVTVVVDNNASRQGLQAEWGLALWLEHDGHVLLLDTGLGPALLPNLAALGLPAARIEGVILSHGHHDHTGGLAALLQTIGGRPVWCHPGVFETHYKQDPDGSLTDIGPPLGSRAAYEKLGADFHLVTGPVEPWPGVHLIAPIPRLTAFEGLNPSLVTNVGPALVPDPLLDDLLLVLETGEGLVAVTGCAHAGVVNILLAVQDFLGQAPAWLVGGFHLDLAPEGQRRASLDHLGLLREIRVAAGHCTGPVSSQALAASLGVRFQALAAGQTLEF